MPGRGNMSRPEVGIEPGQRITILPAAVADGIAAGEVVDRPAAVVKELAENAIDAGAARIDIRVEAAGQGLIEVVDDGQGMQPEDLPVAFARHATSKLRALEELRTIRTLGFRGEALASIAAVAQVEAVSRRRDGGEGFRVRIRGGELLTAEPVGCPNGTRVTVEQLFFNTPARLKFLKQPATENAVISRLVGELALGNPTIAFSLQVDRRRVIETPGTGDLRATFAAAYDSETATARLAIDEYGVHGLISPPALHRGTRDHVVVLVNGRRIQHRNLVFAIEQAYRGLREPDRFPLAVLSVLVNPAEVDVNVHPTKREVRFRNERAVFATLERACYHALRLSPLYELQSTTGGPPLELRETAVFSGGSFSPHPPLQEGRENDEIETPRLPPLTYIGQLLPAYLAAGP